MDAGDIRLVTQSEDAHRPVLDGFGGDDKADDNEEREHDQRFRFPDEDDDDQGGADADPGASRERQEDGRGGEKQPRAPDDPFGKEFTPFRWVPGAADESADESAGAGTPLPLESAEGRTGGTRPVREV